MVLLQTVQVDHLRDLSKSLRRACKLDRDMYISGLADAISNGPPDGVFAALHQILAHRRKRPYTLETVPALQHPDGTACTGPEEMRRLWRSHFGNLEAGEPTAFSAIARDAAEGLGEVAKLPPLAHPPDVSVIASYADMIHILCGTKVAKAPGFDALPPELCRRFPQELAPLLHPILLKTAWRGEEPVGWKGGKAVYFYQNRGEHHSPASYRSVLLLSTWAKVATTSAFGRRLRNTLSKRPQLFKWEAKQDSLLCSGHMLLGRLRPGPRPKGAPALRFSPTLPRPSTVQSPSSLQDQDRLLGLTPCYASRDIYGCLTVN